MINISELTKTSSDENLSLYSYTGDMDTCPKWMTECRGLVVENSSGQILWKTFGFVKEYIEEIPDTIDVSKYKVYPSMEGTCLRLFYYSDKWYLSTHRKLNAFRSRWGSKKSFGHLFVDGLMSGYGLEYPEFLDTLDKEKMYVFFLKCSNDNRVVCFSGPYPAVYHVATFSQDGVENNPANIGINKQVPINPENVIEYVKAVDPYWNQGVILRRGTEEIKIYNKEYLDLCELRGNEPSIVMRYLQIRADVAKYKMFLDLYSDKKDVFDEVESKIKSKCRKMCDLYKTRYTDERFDYLPTTEHLLLETVHRKVRMEGDMDKPDLYMHFLHHSSLLHPIYLHKLLYTY